MKTKLLGLIATLAFFGVVSPSYSGTCPTLDTCGFLDSGGTYTTLSVPGSIYTEPTGINAAGEIVGEYGGTGGAFQGFLYSGGTYTSLPSGYIPSGINNAGQIVGYSYNGPNYQGFLYSGRELLAWAMPGQPCAAVQHPCRQPAERLAEFPGFALLALLGQGRKCGFYCCSRIEGSGAPNSGRAGGAVVVDIVRGQRRAVADVVHDLIEHADAKAAFLDFG